MTYYSIVTPAENSVKYTILINQAQVVAAGLHTQTDLIDWAILDYILNWQSSPNPKIQRIQTDNGSFVWINYKHLINAMPLLGLNTKGAVSNRIKKLKNLKLINVEYDNDGRFFAQTSALFYEITQFSVNPVPPVPLPIPVHQNEHPVHQNEHPVHQNEHPVHQNEHSINHHNQPSQSTIINIADVDFSVLTEKETPAAKKLLESHPIATQIEVMAVLTAMVKVGRVKSTKIGYLRKIVESVNDGSFVPLPTKEKPLTAAERIAKETKAKAESDKRAKAAADRYWAGQNKKLNA